MEINENERAVVQSPPEAGGEVETEAAQTDGGPAAAVVIDLTRSSPSLSPPPPTAASSRPTYQATLTRQRTVSTAPRNNVPATYPHQNRGGLSSADATTATTAAPADMGRVPRSASAVTISYPRPSVTVEHPYHPSRLPTFADLEVVDGFGQVRRRQLVDNQREPTTGTGVVPPVSTTTAATTTSPAVTASLINQTPTTRPGIPTLPFGPRIDRTTNGMPGIPLFPFSFSDTPEATRPILDASDIYIYAMPGTDGTVTRDARRHDPPPFETVRPGLLHELWVPFRDPYDLNQMVQVDLVRGAMELAPPPITRVSEGVRPAAGAVAVGSGSGSSQGRGRSGPSRGRGRDSALSAGGIGGRGGQTGPAPAPTQHFGRGAPAAGPRGGGGGRTEPRPAPTQHVGRGAPGTGPRGRGGGQAGPLPGRTQQPGRGRRVPSAESHRGGAGQSEASMNPIQEFRGGDLDEQLTHATEEYAEVEAPIAQPGRGQQSEAEEASGSQVLHGPAAGGLGETTWQPAYPFDHTEGLAGGGNGRGTDDVPTVYTSSDTPSNPPFLPIQQPGTFAPAPGIGQASRLPGMPNGDEQVQARVDELADLIDTEVHTHHRVLHGVVAAQPEWQNQPFEARTRQLVVVWLRQVETFVRNFMETHHVDQVSMAAANERFDPAPLSRQRQLLEVQMRVENGLPQGTLTISSDVRLRRAVLEAQLLTLQAWSQRWREALPPGHPDRLDKDESVDGDQSIIHQAEGLAENGMSEEEIARITAFGDFMESRGELWR